MQENETIKSLTELTVLQYEMLQSANRKERSLRKVIALHLEKQQDAKDCEENLRRVISSQAIRIRELETQTPDEQRDRKIADIEKRVGKLESMC